MALLPAAAAAAIYALALPDGVRGTRNEGQAQSNRCAGRRGSDASGSREYGM